MRYSLFGLLFLLFSQGGWAAAKIEHWQSSRGTRVYYVHTAGLPMADIRLVFDAGSARDGQQFGISALTSALLDTGAGKWDADTIAQRFESVGAQFGAGISRDMAWLSLRTLTKETLFNKAVETMQVILTDPKFHKNDFDREKNKTLAGLKHREESPGAIASVAFYKAIYGNHPYAHPTDGFTETVTGFTAQDVQAFYRQYYVTANAIVVIVGDLTRKQAEQTVEKLLSGLPAGEQPAELPLVKMPEKGRQEHIEFPSQQTHVVSGVPGIRRNDPDYFSLYVGNHILGGSGLVSQLFKEVREKRGLAYSAHSYFSPMLRKGPFTMGLQTRNDQTEESVKVMVDTLTDFVEKGPTEEQLIASRKNITGGFVLRFDTNSKLTSYAAMIGFYQLPLDYLETFSQKIEAVTAADIKKSFKSRVDPVMLQTITVGGTEKGSEK